MADDIEMSYSNLTDSGDLLPYRFNEFSLPLLDGSNLAALNEYHGKPKLNSIKTNGTISS